MLLTRKEQYAALRPIQDGCPGSIMFADTMDRSGLKSDVVADVGSVMRGNREVCKATADGGYDLWINGKMHKPDVSAKEAIEFLLAYGT